MRIRMLSLFAAFAVAVPALAFVAADVKNIDEAKCPVSGKAAKADQKVAYQGAEVYFCCGNCPAAFEEDTQKFAAKANAQLVVTEQAEQTACPLSGRPTDETKSTEVAGTTVAFCCGNCLAKVEGAEGDEKVIMIFSPTSFEKAFEVKGDN